MIKINFELESLQELQEIHDNLNGMEFQESDFMSSFKVYGEKDVMEFTFGYEDLESVVIERVS